MRRNGDERGTEMEALIKDLAKHFDSDELKRETEASQAAQPEVAKCKNFVCTQYEGYALV